MANHFENLMTNMSDRGLLEYIDEKAIYIQEAVEAAIHEMEKRGRIFSEEEIEKIKRRFKPKVVIPILNESASTKTSDNQWKKIL